MFRRSMGILLAFFLLFNTYFSIQAEAGLDMIQLEKSPFDSIRLETISNHEIWFGGLDSLPIDNYYSLIFSDSSTSESVARVFLFVVFGIVGLAVLGYGILLMLAT